MINIQLISVILIISSIIIFTINHFRHKISQKTNLIDYPDNKRKLHSDPTPLLGGVMVFISFLLINIFFLIFEGFDKTSFFIFIGCLFCIILGLVDDTKGISYKYKFIVLIVIFYFLIKFDVNLQINKVYFSTFNREFHLNYFSIPFTILCLLLLLNALNLVDGINGLCIVISIILILWLINTSINTNNLYVALIGSLIFVLYLNLKNTIFLGDSGSLFLGCVIGLNIIANYNFEISKNNYPVENIFIALMLPGLDMLRVFAERIINKKNPFFPDRRHLHHLLIAKKINLLIILIIFITLILSPMLISYFFNIKEIYIILSFILFYLILINKIKQKL